MKTTKKTSIDTQSFSLWEKVAGIACRMRVIHNITNSHQLKDSSRWSQPTSLIGIDHSRLNPLMAISPILIFAFLLPLSFNLLTSSTALAVEPTIGLSILATDGNTNSNIAIQSPSGGGIAVGRHTLVVNTNSYKGYTVSIGTTDSSQNGNKLVNVDNPAKTINSVDATLDSPAPLASNTWGIAAPGQTGFNKDDEYTNNNASAKYSAVPLGVYPSLQINMIMHKDSPSAAAGDKQVVVYGVDANGMLTAGSYQATVTYTAVTQLPSYPTIQNIYPNNYQLGSSASSKITIYGVDLASTDEVYIDLNSNGRLDSGEECTSLTIVSDNSVTCNVPTASTINPGSYDLHLSAQGGDDTGKFSYIYVEPTDPPTITKISPNAGTTGVNRQVTVEGDNLKTVNNAYVDINKNGSYDDGEQCGNISNMSNTSFTCNVPGGKPGVYDFYVTTPGGTANLLNAYVYYDLVATSGGTGITYASYSPQEKTNYVGISGQSVAFAVEGFDEWNNKTRFIPTLTGQKIDMETIIDFYIGNPNRVVTCKGAANRSVVRGEELETPRANVKKHSGYFVGCHSDDTTWDIQNILSEVASSVYDRKYFIYAITDDYHVVEFIHRR